MSCNAPPTDKPGPRQIGGMLRAAFGILQSYPVLIPLCLVTLFAELIYSGINNVTLLPYVSKLGATTDNDGIVVGYLCSTFLLAETFLRVPFGWLSDRIGRVKMVVSAMLLSAPSFFLGGTVPMYTWLFPLRWWDGMMAAALWPSVFALVGDAVPQERRANAMGAINMMYMLGLFGGGAVAAGLLDRTGTAKTFFFLSSLLMAVGGMLAWFVFSKHRPAMPAALTAEAPTIEPEPDADEPPLVTSPWRHLPLLVITFVQNFAILILAPYIFGYARADLHFDMRSLAILVGAPVVGIALFALPLSRVGDIIGKVTVVRLAFTTIAVALWAFAVNRSLIGLSLITAVIGVAFAMGIPAWLAILTSLSGRKRRGVTFALYGTVQGLSAVIGPLVGGQIWNRASHASIFIASAAAITVGALLTWVALPKQHETVA